MDVLNHHFFIFEQVEDQVPFLFVSEWGLGLAASFFVLERNVVVALSSLPTLHSLCMLRLLNQIDL
jgi:hypothetical protein